MRVSTGTGNAMEVIVSVDKMQKRALGWRGEGLNVGLVATMGALHEAHLGLVRRALELADRVVVSIFVNPLQFGPSEDFDSYPRQLEEDCRELEALGVHCVFAPRMEQMYPRGFQTTVKVKELSRHLCGKFRPGHFDGVATVVLKLFNICQPTLAVFGEKDYQQVRVIEQMVRDLNVPVRVVGHPTVREPDGLAMSSRNRYLTADERRAAPAVFRTLQALKERVEKGEREAAALRDEGRRMLEAEGLRVQYLDICDPRTLEDVHVIRSEVLIATAAFLGKARLIDNVLASPPSGDA